MTHKWLEITVKLIGEDYKENVEVYTQRLQIDYVHTQRPELVTEVIAVINGLGMPRQVGTLIREKDVNEAFDKEYALHKKRS
jgi:hypothetical protein